ncbi:hypothetical protein [Endozoicomonas sp.]|uniref:hypothetical protein n=1 Tax=Endozoicomonas sp. TaxID=1892382 RepID=UPI0028836829|nr:hypothetical protein [Endozoicomonas sp.]
MSPSLPLSWRMKRLYVRFMLAFLGHGLAKACGTDRVIRQEIASLPEGFTFSMGVMPSGPSLCMKKDNGQLKAVSNHNKKPDVDIQFKHLGHAFGTLSFQEGTAEAFARERMVVDGDIPASMKLVRCFERLEVLTLPKLIARRIMRYYPAITLKEKLAGALQIYLGVIKGFVVGVVK